MTTQYKHGREKQLYNFLDDSCIGRVCWNPGPYYSYKDHRDKPSHCCLRRAHHGCPDPLPNPQQAFIIINHNHGWRKAVAK